MGKLEMTENDNMERKPYEWKNVVLGIIIIVVCALLGWNLLRYLCNEVFKTLKFLYDNFSKMDAVVIVAFITGAFSIVAVCISTIVGNIITAQQSNREYLTKKREGPYEDFVEMIYRIQMSTKEGYEYSEQEMLEDISKVSKQITLWGSKNVVDKWVMFRENSTNKDNAVKNLFILEEIMNDMRKDLGVKRVKKGNLLAFFVNDIKKVIK